MALCASGAMSLGGATTGRSVNLELGCSATAAICMNRTDVRTLAEVASGAISMSNFYGKSSAPPPPTTLGTYYPDYGGYYVGTSSGYYLFATVAANDGGPQSWKTTGTISGSTSSETDGYSNTYAQNNSAHPHHNNAGTLSAGGFSDWYLGAKCELLVTFYARNCGSQPCYICGSQNQWTSTEHNSTCAYFVSFSPNYNVSNAPTFGKQFCFLSRPLRREPV